MKHSILTGQKHAPTMKYDLLSRSKQIIGVLRVFCMCVRILFFQKSPV